MFPVLFDYSSCHIIWGELFRSFRSVQYPVNNDVSVNAFSSDSPMDSEVEEIGAEGGTVRYTQKNSSSYFITCKIRLFMIACYSIQNAPKCMIFHFRS